MKKTFLIALLLCVASLVLSGIGQAFVVSPNPQDSQLPLEVLVGLIGKYTTMIDQYAYMIAQGGQPDSAIEFRLAADIDFSGVAGSLDPELGPILTGISKIAFWVNINIFSRYPSTVAMTLSGTFGDIGLFSTESESILVYPDGAVFAKTDPRLGAGTPPPSVGVSPPIPVEQLQDQIALLLQGLPSIGMEYGGLGATPKGMAHIVKLIPPDKGIITNLWVLDETWELCKVEFVDLQSGTGATMIIKNAEFVTSLPDSTFSVDTSALAEIPYDELVGMLGLTLFSKILAGEPVAADLYASTSKVYQGAQVVVFSSGLDDQDSESELTAQIEYRSPNGSWTPLKSEYVGTAPFGSWQAVFTPALTDEVGSYDLRVTYTDSSGNVSTPLELLGALTVVATPPQVVSVSPSHREEDVSVSLQVGVTFSQEMDKASVESAFLLTDESGQAVSGSFEWSGASFVFKPAQNLAYDRNYQAKILGSAMGVNMATLDGDMDKSAEGSPIDDFVWRFSTESMPLPKVAKFAPADKQVDVPISAKITATFTEAMDQPSVENAFSIMSADGQPVSGSFQWADNTLTFTPSQELAYNATYKVRILGSAKSSLGAGLDGNGNGIAEGSPVDDLSWWFSVEKASVLAASVKTVGKDIVVGDVFTVHIVVEGVSQLDNFSFGVNFNPAILKVLKVERGSFVNWRPKPRIIEEVDVWLPVAIDAEKGTVTIAISKTRTGGVGGTGAIATLTLQAIGAGESLITFQNISFANVLGESITPVPRDAKVRVLEFALRDVNNDGVIDIKDFIIARPDIGVKVDVNGDGIIDIQDFVKLQPEGANLDVNGDGVIDIHDLVIILGGAKGSPAIPLTDELGYNFPNPLNPITWIPYKLANGADVVIRIYDVKGHLVKSLDLGYKCAGFYTTKATAAYWDGTNENGERVASGIYFYNIKAGNFVATRKMMVLE